MPASRPRTTAWKKRTKLRKAKLLKAYDTKLGIPPAIMEVKKKGPKVSKKKIEAAPAGKAAPAAKAAPAKAVPAAKAAPAAQAAPAAKAAPAKAAPAAKGAKK